MTVPRRTLLSPSNMLPCVTRLIPANHLISENVRVHLSVLYPKEDDYCLRCVPNDHQTEYARDKYGEFLSLDHRCQPIVNFAAYLYSCKSRLLKSSFLVVSVWPTSFILVWAKVSGLQSQTARYSRGKVSEHFAIHEAVNMTHKHF
jgi:hypothetical protein